MSTQHILLVEDDATEAKLARRTLSKLAPDLEVTRLSNGADFLAYYHDHPDDDISLAIMDLHMPEVGGLDVLEALNKEGSRPRFPIVVFSSSEDAKEVSRTYELGGSAFVTKPTSGSAYREALRNMLNFWITTNRLK